MYFRGLTSEIGRATSHAAVTSCAHPPEVRAKEGHDVRVEGLVERGGAWGDRPDGLPPCLRPARGGTPFIHGFPAGRARCTVAPCSCSLEPRR